MVSGDKTFPDTTIDELGDAISPDAMHVGVKRSKRTPNIINNALAILG